MRTINTQWLFKVFCWDGVLPAVAGLCSVVVKVCFPKGHIAGVIAIWFVPLFLSLLRAGRANAVLREVAGGRLLLLRHVAMAIAIILLMFIEMVLAAMVFEPAAAWFPVVVTAWLIYFGLISAATWPVPHAEHCDNATSRG